MVVFWTCCPHGASRGNIRFYLFFLENIYYVKTSKSPSTRDVSNVTLAALRRPAGKLSPIFSSFSRRHFPPFLDLALSKPRKNCMKITEGQQFQCNELKLQQDTGMSASIPHVPSQHTPQKGGIEALGWGQSPLHFPYCHFVLGGGAEQ